jgi:hypothetical protein
MGKIRRGRVPPHLDGEGLKVNRPARFFLERDIRRRLNLLSGAMPH